MSCVLCTSAGSKHTVWGTIRACGAGTLMVEKGAALSGDWRKNKNKWFRDHRHFIFLIIKTLFQKYCNSQIVNPFLSAYNIAKSVRND